MLQVRAVAPPGHSETAALAIDRLDGVSNVVASDVTVAGDRVVTADVDGASADRVLDALTQSGIAPDAITLVRLETVPPVESRDGVRWFGGATDAPSWAEVVGAARGSSRLLARYAVLMAAAGVIASVGVLDSNEILIVGAMAISPDLLPMAAACVGVVGRRPRLVLRAVFSLVVGLAIASAAAAIAGRSLEALGVFDDSIGSTLGTLTTTDPSTIVIALAAGVAGMFAFETRAGSAVGVAISITTIPAAAYFGVTLGSGEARDALSALGVLGTNITCVLVAGSITLLVQRWWRQREAR